MIEDTSDECFFAVLQNIKNKNWPSRFDPNPSPWFPNDGERCVEIPWALSRYRGQKKLLEIGLPFLDLSMVRAQIQLQKITGCRLFGMDFVELDSVLNRFKKLNFDIREYYTFYKEDLRKISLKNNLFDLIFCVSTIEHVGFDKVSNVENTETAFIRSEKDPESLPEYDSCKDDQKALAEIKRILAPGGSLLLTVPFGNRGICKLKDTKGLWALYKEYSLDEWKILIKSSCLEISDERFFYNRKKKGWSEEKNPNNLEQNCYAKYDPVKQVACVELRKV